QQMGRFAQARAMRAVEAEIEESRQRRGSRHFDPSTSEERLGQVSGLGDSGWAHELAAGVLREHIEADEELPAAERAEVGRMLAGFEARAIRYEVLGRLLPTSRCQVAVDEAAADIEALAPGQALLIPTGFRSADGGHATALEVERAAGGSG